MIDFQSVYAQEMVSLSNVRTVNGPPRSIIVTGEDFRSVESVIINGDYAPEVVITKRTQLIAQVPSSQLVNRVQTVVVLNQKLTLSLKSSLKFRIGNKPGKATGVLKLSQKYLRVLMTTPGSDVFNPNLGGGLLNIIKSQFGIMDGSVALHNAVIAADTATRQVIALQSQNSRLPLDERLLSATVTEAQFDKSTGSILLTVEIESQAGRLAVANLGL